MGRRFGIVRFTITAKRWTCISEDERRRPLKSVIYGEIPESSIHFHPLHVLFEISTSTALRTYCLYKFFFFHLTQLRSLFFSDFHQCLSPGGRRSTTPILPTLGNQSRSEPASYRSFSGFLITQSNNQSFINPKSHQPSSIA